MMPEEIVGDAMNFVNSRDFVSKTDLVGMWVNRDSVTLTTYMGDSLLWINDHYIDNPGYQGAMKQSIGNYQELERWKL